jgi:hypothetical protein
LGVSTEAKPLPKRLANIVALLSAVEAAGEEAFSPVLRDGAYVVSPLLLNVRAALDGAPAFLEEKARAAFKKTVGGNVVRLDATDDTNDGEVTDLNRSLRRGAR